MWQLLESSFKGKFIQIDACICLFIKECSNWINKLQIHFIDTRNKVYCFNNCKEWCVAIQCNICYCCDSIKWFSCHQTSTQITVTMTTTVAIPSNGKIVMTLPEQFKISARRSLKSLDLTLIDSFDGNTISLSNVVVNGQTITTLANGTPIGSYTLSISGFISYQSIHWFIFQCCHSKCKWNSTGIHCCYLTNNSSWTSNSIPTEETIQVSNAYKWPLQLSYLFP